MNNGLVAKVASYDSMTGPYLKTLKKTANVHEYRLPGFVLDFIYLVPMDVSERECIMQRHILLSKTKQNATVQGFLALIIWSALLCIHCRQ